jgi:hypothetical protein
MNYTRTDQVRETFRLEMLLLADFFNFENRIKVAFR